MSDTSAIVPLTMPVLLENSTYQMPDGSTLTDVEVRRWVVERICAMLDINLLSFVIDDNRMTLKVRSEFGEREFVSKWGNHPLVIEEFAAMIYRTLVNCWVKP